MSLTLTSEAIVLAINSAIKLSGRLQRAYANSIKAKSILLPLPKFDVRPNADRAHRFFKHEGGRLLVDRFEQLKHLFDEFELRGLDSSQQEEYIDLYIQLSMQQDKDLSEEVDDAHLNLDSMLALLSIRQWETGKMPRTSPVKMVAGTLVEIGIDYFNQVPGALNPDSSYGQVIKHFLSAVDCIDIVETEDLKSISELVVPKLFIAAAESLETLSTEISGDEKVQSFINLTSRGIAEEVIQRSQEVAFADRDEPVKWGQLILRSMVQHAGHYVFKSPARFLDVNEGTSQLVKATGEVLLDAILTDPDKINLRDGFNIDTLDDVVRTGLGVIAEHPELIDGRDGFREIISGVSVAMAEAGIKDRPDLLPELVRLILQHTSGNLHVLLPTTGTNGKHLLVIAVQELLAAISQPVTEGHWKVRLPGRQLLSIAEDLLEEVVVNPNWILEKTGDKTMLRQTLDAAFQGLAGLPKEERLNKEVLQLVIQLSIQTVVTNQSILDRLQWADDEREKTILTKSLDLVFSFVFTSGRVAPVERVELLVNLLEYTTEVILSKHPNAQGLMLLDLILFKDPNVRFSGGFNRELADALITSCLSVIESHPELVSRQLSLQHIISGIAGALDATALRSPEVLPELVRLCLWYTAENAHLVVVSEDDEPRYLLVLAMRHLLASVAAPPAEDEQWRPRLNAGQLLSLSEDLFDQLVHHPQWLIPDDENQTLFGSVLDTVFQSLRALPKTERLHPANLRQIIQLSLHTVVGHPTLLKRVHWGSETEEAAILRHCLDLVLSYVFERSQTDAGARLQLLSDLLHYVLETLMAQYPDRKGLLLLDLVLFEDPDVDFSRGFRPELSDQLINAAIKVLDYRPDLVTKHSGFQHLIEVVAGSLKETGYKHPDLLPQLLRLVLEYTAENTDLVLPTDDGQPRFLLAAILQSLLKHLDREEVGDRLNPGRLLDVVEDVLDYVVSQPQLVTQKLRQGTLFSLAVDALFDALAQLPESRRWQAETLSWLLHTTLQTVASNEMVLKKIHWGPDEQESIILKKALDLVFQYAAKTPDRLAGIADLLAYVMEFVITQHKDKKAILILYLLLYEDPELGFRPFPHLEEEDLVDAALRVLDAYPELLSHDAVWQKIIQDTARALKDAKLERPDLLPELLRLTMLYTAEHVSLLANVNPSSPQYILTVAIEQALRAIAQPPKRGRWKPTLNQEQLLDVVQICLDVTIQNPLWVKDKLLFNLLEAVLTSLQRVPKERKLPFETIRLLIQASLEAVSFRKNLVVEVVHQQGRRQVIALNYALEGLFVALYDEGEQQEAASWTLTQTHVLDAIIESFLQGLIKGPITKDAIHDALEPVREAIDDLAQNAAFDLENLLDALEQ